MNNDLFYDEQRGYVEDWELWRRAFEKGMTVGCIHKVLFYHRWLNTGSAGQTSKTVDMMRELVQKNFAGTWRANFERRSATNWPVEWKTGKRNRFG